MAAMNIETIAVGPLGTNCYIAWNDPGRVMVVDPGDDSRMILDFLAEQHLVVAAYIATHGHVDHISALAALHRALPAPIGMSSADEAWAFNQNNRLPPLYGVPERPAKISLWLKDGVELDIIGVKCAVIATPGHSPGGVCLHFPAENVLFSGDTLFRGSIGRTDLPGSDPHAMERSLSKLTGLPPATRVFPGHGPSTTMGHELNVNPFLRSI